MHEKESDIFMGERMEDRMATTVISTDLGPNNKGSIGPTHLDDSKRSQIDDDISKPEYRVGINSNEWHCVDDRFLVDPETGEEYPGQIAGSVPVSETAAEFMINKDPKKLSEVLAAKTLRAVNEGLEVFVHGDEAHGKDGCGANSKLRMTLQSNAENVDHVAPRKLALGKAVGLDKFGITEDDVVGLIIQGGRAANQDELWDVDASDSIDIMVANGAIYEEYKGPHYGVKVVVETDKDKTFNGSKFSEDHTFEDADPEKVFVASLGAYVEKAFERGRANGRSDYDIALECYAVIAFQVGVPKEIGNENLEVAILANQ